MQKLQQQHKTSINDPKVQVKQELAKELPVEDDRYPGSFFKVPGVPRPGSTSWRIS